jgi:hypothetical protein
MARPADPSATRPVPGEPSFCPFGQTAPITARRATLPLGTQAQGILRRLDAAKTLADKAKVLSLVAQIEGPTCPRHPLVRLTCQACRGRRGGRVLTAAKLAQLKRAARRPRPGARKGPTPAQAPAPGSARMGRAPLPSPK